MHGIALQRDTNVRGQTTPGLQSLGKLVNTVLCTVRSFHTLLGRWSGVGIRSRRSRLGNCKRNLVDVCSGHDWWAYVLLESVGEEIGAFSFCCLHSFGQYQ